MSLPTPLSPDQLRRRCDPSTLDFETTAELPLLDEVLGQPRAVAALEFGLDIPCQGFHLFALGLAGSGRTTLIRGYLEHRASTQKAPDDLCFVHNFDEPRRPLPLLLPAGQARPLAAAVRRLIAELRSAIPKAFDTPEYTEHRDTLVRDLDARRQQIFEEMGARAAAAGFTLAKAPSGLLMLLPAVGGRVLPDEEIEKLTIEQRQILARSRERLQKELESHLRAVREAEKNARAVLDTLDNETAAGATRHLVAELRAHYTHLPQVVAYLDALEAGIIASAGDFKQTRESEQQENPLAAILRPSTARAFTTYEVNVLVDNSSLTGAPVVFEPNPTYHNLTGRIEHQATLGEVHTDHTMIKPGALHRANGGYLLLPARECLMNPYAWEALKRALKTREIDVEELGSQLSLISTVTLDPSPVPLDVKVVLIGSPQIYYALSAYDEDFQKLFKVKAEFASRMKRTPESERSYALFVNSITGDSNLQPYHRDAVARIVEYGSRLAGDQDWLTARFADIADLVREAAHRSARNHNSAVTAADVSAAEAAHRFRQNLAEERYLEAMVEGTILLETEGAAVGRLNGLTVVSLGDYEFGHPARITATTGPGRSGVVSIEREVELSGPIHGKGVLILSGYLLRQYGRMSPLSVAASLVFEQTYGMVDGDSASLTELLALLSSIADVPLRQDIAITGSVNQHGDIQPVGGVTQKIEGFFDLCAARGLTGSQGVLIPCANRRSLTLRDDVIDAVRQDRFHVYTARHVDDALELLTGVPAAELIHPKVAEELARYAESLKLAEKAPSPPEPAPPPSE